ncbi:MAG: hypothetical protein BJ554DRAFT_4197 [Olpidium bornovanus]|uniref:Uncharacterized protein n=1 Tax=Olpidium bornovanus TaxID=278681 RepID=A0A8H8DF94_9FUNG|nr:MAG: hypothetical protein BJ554DRAFT_4197 [Olpidium bornovanus]
MSSTTTGVGSSSSSRFGWRTYPGRGKEWEGGGAASSPISTPRAPPASPPRLAGPRRRLPTGAFKLQHMSPQPLVPKGAFVSQAESHNFYRLRDLRRQPADTAVLLAGSRAAVPKLGLPDFRARTVRLPEPGCRGWQAGAAHELWRAAGRALRPRLRRSQHRHRGAPGHLDAKRTPGMVDGYEHAIV